MTTTVENVAELSGEEHEAMFNSLYADSIDDMNAGSFWFPEDATTEDEKKSHIRNTIFSPSKYSHKLIFKKDGTAIMLVGGFIDNFSYYPNGDYKQDKITLNNMFIYHVALIGNHSGTKDWLRTSEFYNAVKTYMLSIPVAGYIVPAVKSKSVDVAFKQSQVDGFPLGNYTLVEGSTVDNMIWIY